MIESFLLELDNRYLNDDDNLSLIEMQEKNNVLYLTFKLEGDFDREEEPQIWKISCHDFVKRCIYDDFFNSFAIFEEHALLWSYKQPKGSLYFKGTTKDVSGLIGELYLKHLNITDDWIPFSEFLNDMVDIKELITGGYGLLAEGPMNIIKEYSEVLNRFNIETSLISDGIIRYWDGHKWVSGAAPYYILVFGHSYVIAKEFKEERIQ